MKWLLYVLVHQGDRIMELLFKKNVIGNIDIRSKENQWVHGVFTQNDNFYHYEDFFKAIVCEDGFDEMQFDGELMKDNHWNVNDNGNIMGIYIPAIYDDGDIFFRYRIVQRDKKGIEIDRRRKTP